MHVVQVILLNALQNLLLTPPFTALTPLLFEVTDIFVTTSGWKADTDYLPYLRCLYPP